jgi:hypothetical protein
MPSDLGSWDYDAAGGGFTGRKLLLKSSRETGHFPVFSRKPFRGKDLSGYAPSATNLAKIFW